jgi:hypothetical protein
VKKNILTTSVFATLLLASTIVTAEEQYPAADFQPTVVYSDSAEGSSAKSEEPVAAKESVKEEKSESGAEKKAESSNNFLLGIVVLAVAGGVFLSRKPKAKAGSADSEYAPASVKGEVGGQTGVEKYLQAKNAASATGVEKYLARKEAADRESSVTGVEKYLRNRG